MVAGIGLGERGELAGRRPIKTPSVHDDSTQRRAVAAEELGNGVQHDVCTMLDGPDEIGRGKRGVDH